MPAPQQAAGLLAANSAPAILSDGTLDGGFDDDGMLSTAIGGGPDVVSSVVLQPDGKIVLAGYSFNGSNFDIALARYNANGSLDTSFSDDGKLTTLIGSGDDLSGSVALQPDGKILVGGHTFNGLLSDFALVRYNANGSLDTSFSGDGKPTVSIGSGDDLGGFVAMQPDGKVLVAGRSSNGLTADFALIRYNADGSLDTSFDGDGKLTTSIGSDDQVSSVALQPDGKILVAGISLTGLNYDLALARYNTNGSLDTSFDDDGVLTTAVGGGDELGGFVALQPDGKILVAGSSSN